MPGIGDLLVESWVADCPGKDFVASRHSCWASCGLRSPSDILIAASSGCLALPLQSAANQADMAMDVWYDKRAKAPGTPSLALSLQVPPAPRSALGRRSAGGLRLAG